MSSRTRLALAVLIAAVGLVVAWRALARFRSGPRPSGPVPVEVAPQARALLASIELDARPAEETASDLVAQAASRVRDVATGQKITALGAGDRLNDLLRAFHERLFATIAGDFDRNVADLVGRGDSKDHEGDRDAWTRRLESHRMIAFGIRQIEVRELYRGGRRIAPPKGSDGLASLEFQPERGRFPISNDAEAGRLDVVEVRLPMRKRRIIIPAGDQPASFGEWSLVRVGYRFAWSNDRRQWIPWGVCIYSDPNEAHSSISF